MEPAGSSSLIGFVALLTIIVAAVIAALAWSGAMIPHSYALIACFLGVDLVLTAVTMARG